VDTSPPVDTGPFDADGDGVFDKDDCAPDDPDVHGGAPDEDLDGVDQNCDGVDGTDVDQDGYAATWTGGTDCDDTNPAVHLGAASEEPELCTVDADEDGYGSDTVGAGVDAGSDCDDDDEHVSPWHGEWRDGKDNDCDGAIDEDFGEADALSKLSWGSGTGLLGYAMTLVDDLDGDGVPEIAIAAEKQGGAALYTGAMVGDIDVSTGMTLTADTSMLPGRSMASGELTADGVPDLIVAVPRYWDSTGQFRGGAFVVSGDSTGSLALSDADALLQGNGFDAILGYGAAAVDLDGDGQEDLASGSSMVTASEGSILVALGPLTTTVDHDDADATLKPDTDGSVNWAVLTSTDHDGDGLDELVVGAPYDKSYDGAVYVIPHGASGTAYLTDVATLVVRGETTGPRYPGLSLAGGDDVDGDGLDDLAFGGHSDAWLVWGNTTGELETTDMPVHIDGDDQLGASVALGDFNADGLVDLAVGAPDADPGEVRIYLNGATGTVDAEADADRVIVGRDEDSAFGWAMVGGVDLSGDSLADLLIGAPYADSQAGYAWLLEGP